MDLETLEVELIKRQKRLYISPPLDLFSTTQFVRVIYNLIPNEHWGHKVEMGINEIGAMQKEHGSSVTLGFLRRKVAADFAQMLMSFHLASQSQPQSDTTLEVGLPYQEKDGDSEKTYIDGLFAKHFPETNWGYKCNVLVIVREGESEDDYIKRLYQEGINDYLETQRNCLRVLAFLEEQHES